MSTPNNLVLELRELRNDVAAFRTDIGARIGRVELRLSAIEARLGSVESRLADIEAHHEQRLERLERRFGLHDTEPAQP